MQWLPPRAGGWGHRLVSGLLTVNDSATNAPHQHLRLSVVRLDLPWSFPVHLKSKPRHTSLTRPSLVLGESFRLHRETRFCLGSRTEWNPQRRRRTLAWHRSAANKDTAAASTDLPRTSLFQEIRVPLGVSGSVSAGCIAPCTSQCRASSTARYASTV